MTSAHWEPEMVRIPAGWFWMGTDRLALEWAGIEWRDWFEPETSYHQVHLPDYAIGKYPVTNAQYAAFVRAAGHRPPRHWRAGRPASDKEDHPIVYVSWDDAVAYCDWLAQVTGKPYGLPSEAEWEKGARGSDGRIYPWGDEWDVERCNNVEGGDGDTTPVGAYPQGASPYGLLDMAGNVGEWTRSLYRGYPYDPGDGREDLEAGRNAPRATRGGAFTSFAQDLRCAVRLSTYPGVRSVDCGFRVVASPVRL